MVEFSTTHPNGVVLYQHHQAHERTDSSAFFHGLERALQDNKPDRIVVGLGPGSYNGLRSSIAAAQGIASACGIDLIGISSALAFEEKNYWIAGDARGGQYWLASVVDHQFLQEPFLLAPEEIFHYLEAHPDFSIFSYNDLPHLSSSLKITIRTPDAIMLARLGKNATATKNLVPLYLKPAHITMPRS